MTSFQEQFPELKNLQVHETWKPNKDMIWLHKEDVEKHCLSKQRVKEAINFAIENHTLLLKNSRNGDLLVNELGCRVAIATLNVLKRELGLNDEPKFGSWTIVDKNKGPHGLEDVK